MQRKDVLIIYSIFPNTELPSKEVKEQLKQSLVCRGRSVGQECAKYVPGSPNSIDSRSQISLPIGKKGSFVPPVDLTGEAEDIPFLAYSRMHNPSNPVKKNTFIAQEREIVFISILRPGRNACPYLVISLRGRLCSASHGDRKGDCVLLLRHELGKEIRLNDK